MAETMGMLAPLADVLAQEPHVRAAAQQVSSMGCARVYGAPHAALPALAGALCSPVSPLHVQQLLVVTTRAEAAVGFMEDLRPWLPGAMGCELFPALEGLPYERVSVEPPLMQQRQHVLELLVDGAPLAIVAPVRALLQPLLDPGQYHRAIRRLRVGSRCLVTAEVASWRTLGYAPVTAVQQPGQFSRRGGILDIFPAGAPWPVRIELLGSEVESLRQFDPTSQRSIAPIEAVVIGPAHPFLLPAPERAIKELEALDRSRCLPHVISQWEDDLRCLREGTPFEGMEFYTPYLLDGGASLLRYLGSECLVFLDDPEEQQELTTELLGQTGELQHELLGRGEIPPGLRSPLMDWSLVQEEMVLLPHVGWHSRPVRDAEDWSSGSVLRTAPSYAGSIKRFVQDCDELRHQQERVCIVSLQAPRLHELLQEAGVPCVETDRLTDPPERGSVAVLSYQLSEGWYAPNAHLMVFSDTEVAGWTRVHRPARFHRPATTEIALDFAPGDYVVHIEYGIGRFQGVVRETTARGEREYLDLQFAGTDRLKVPTDKLDRVTKYRGMGEAAPPLSRLGTQEWARTKARVREAAEQVARELLELFRYRQEHSGHAYAHDNHWQKELEAAFPYEETPDQARAIQDVKADMEAPRPMDRLVCGDVGYGKTEVAIRAAFKAVMDGRQVAVLVPTTVLAQQHFNTFTERMQAFPVEVAVLSRFHGRAHQTRVLNGTRDGSIDIVIGTHRLLQKDVGFKNLGLVVIDEEHRFGVKAKETLKRFRRDVDVLTLTATPIPRSLHMALMQVRDMSVIATSPEGRLPIKTYLEPFDEYHIREAILRELDRDGQVYFVHNKVQTIEAIAERLRHLAPGARVGVGHGQMPEADLEHVMFDFASGKIDVLVCSTIIESGLDIPNVNTMFINDAPHFGLAQLHQLRGRIGRGSRRGYAYLLYNGQARISRIAERRLKAIFETTDLGAGFQLAMVDLEIRGAGNVLGAEQSGHMAAVGFQLYSAMLGEAIERQRGRAPEQVEERAHPVISIPVDTFIPSTYVEDENQRLRLYQRVAAAEHFTDLQAIADEFRDRFGPMPEPVRKLLATARLRMKAAQLAITSIQVDQHQLLLQGTLHTVYDRVAAYPRYGRDVRIDRGVLRLPAGRLNGEPLDAIETLLDDALALQERVHGASRR
jgi:transcription-repair coupling factor (superfamily II helicase)